MGKNLNNFAFRRISDLRIEDALIAVIYQTNQYIIREKQKLQGNCRKTLILGKQFVLIVKLESKQGHVIGLGIENTSRKTFK